MLDGLVVADRRHHAGVPVVFCGFWEKWKNEYLYTLQERQKWQESVDNLKKDDVVLLKSDNFRNDWPLGLVLRTFPGADGLVRKIEVQVTKDDKKSTYVRPVTDVVLLLPAL